LDIFNASYWMNQLMALPAILIALSMHELSHGWVSNKLGDPTPKMQGRLTLNPLAHLDLVGTICLFFFHFGWAKPVQINTQYYKHPKRDIILVSLAGVVMNFILAFVTLFIVALMEKYMAPMVPHTESAVRLYNIVSQMFFYGVTINLGLGVFNLIPVPPLDGSKVLFAVLPSRYYNSILKYEQYGMIILMVLLFTNVITKIMTPCVTIIYQFFLMIINLIL